jgi:hypothetical protein
MRHIEQSEWLLTEVFLYAVVFVPEGFKEEVPQNTQR